jgi:AraC-like DNA-binding protein
MLHDMTLNTSRRLNDSGEEGVARIFGSGALHHSRGQSTSWHSHYAWKVHVGLDAPVWLEWEAGPDPQRVAASAIVVPPGVEHRTGAVGWSSAVFLAPGSWGLPWKATGGPVFMQGAAATRVLEQCHAFDIDARDATSHFAGSLLPATITKRGTSPIDARVEHALRLISHAPELTLPEVARRVGLCLDRVSRLTIRDTGITLRQHVLWRRVTRLLSSGQQYPSLAAAALAAGFSDHAHMTRTFRHCLGRVPSDFKAPPDVVAPW